MQINEPWQDKEKRSWFERQQVVRSYQQDVVARLEEFTAEFFIEQYGALSVNVERYPLYALRSRLWNDENPTLLVTGGVHGYETSGVQGALEFLHQAPVYSPYFNIVVCPCVSPWGYETINRWNSQAIDPNRSFIDAGASEEAQALTAYYQRLIGGVAIHIDLHETTDTDNTVFRPALAARDGLELANWGIPDGFYLVADSEKPCDDFHQAIISAVAKVTHIADADGNGALIGEPVILPGVINYPAKALGLCAALTNATYVTTTEVYPDSPKVDSHNCVRAQVEVITAALNYYRQNNINNSGAKMHS